MEIAMCYWRLKGFNGTDQFIGGIETYLLNLNRLCQRLGISVTLYQCASREFVTDVEGLRVVGVKTPNLMHTERSRRVLAYRAFSSIDVGKDIILFGGDQWSIPTDYPRAIAIQHGIGWDCPIQLMTKKKALMSGLGEQIKRLSLRRRWLNYFRNCRNRVCVDYNFYNWYKTYATIRPEENIWIIPNSAEIADKSKVEEKWAKKDKVIRILFSRRFEKRRGIRVIAEAATQILRKYNHVEFTFAGEGDDRCWLASHFKEKPRVSITKYLPAQSQQVHLSHDIAVAPSLGSEGTTLSVAEALGAGCAVVASPVGGITNMILSGYNGILVQPKPNNIAETLTRLINDEHMRLRLSRCGYETASNVFSIGTWEDSWAQVVEWVKAVK